MMLMYGKLTKGDVIAQNKKDWQPFTSLSMNALLALFITLLACRIDGWTTIPWIIVMIPLLLYDIGQLYFTTMSQYKQEAYAKSKTVLVMRTVLLIMFHTFIGLKLDQTLVVDWWLVILPQAMSVFIDMIRSLTIWVKTKRFYD